MTYTTALKKEAIMNNDLEKRISKLENRIDDYQKQLFRWKVAAGITLVIFLAVGIVTTYSAVNAQTTTNALYIKDGKARIRISIGIMPDNAPGIVMYDADGAKRIILSVANDGKAYFIMRDKNRKTKFRKEF